MTTRSDMTAAVRHDSFCYEPRGSCYFLTCSCPCHQLCPVHGYRQPCFECKIIIRAGWAAS